MSRTFQEVIRIVLQATGADSADKLADALGNVGDISEEARDQLLTLADAMAKAAGAGELAESYRKTGQEVRKIDQSYRELGATVKQLDGAEKSSAAVLAEKRRALADAQRTQKAYADGTHGLLGTEKQIRDARKQAADAVKALTAEVKAAERVNKADVTALERQRAELAKVAKARQDSLTTLRQQKAALQAAGVDTSRLAAEEKRLVAESLKAETAMRELAQATREQAAVAGQAAGNQKSLWQALGETKLALAGAAAGMVGVTRVLSSAAKESAEFEKSMAALSTIAQGSDLRAIGNEVRGLGTAYGNVQAQAKGLYEIIAAGIEDTAAATEILDTANRLAIGGVADLEASAGGLVAALNAYGKSASEAKAVSDQFFVSAAAGNTTIEELAQNIGGVAPLAATAGVSLDQLLASVGALTAGGVETAQAFTQVQSVIAAVVKPTSQAQKAAEELGIQFDTAALRSKGFAGFLNEIAEAAGHDETVLAKLFGRVEGLQGVLSLTGNLAGTFSKTLDDMANSAGRTNSAFAKMNDTSAQAAVRFKASVDNLKISIGDVVTSMTPLLNGITFLINGFNSLPEPVRQVAVALGVLAGTAIPLAALVGALKKVRDGMLGAESGSSKLGKAVGDLAKGLTIAGAAYTTFLGFLAESDRRFAAVTDSFVKVNTEATKFARRIHDLRGEFSQPLFEELLKDNPAKAFEDLNAQIARTQEQIERLQHIKAMSLGFLTPNESRELQTYVEQLEALQRTKQLLASQTMPLLTTMWRSLGKAAADTADEMENGTRALAEAFDELGIKSQASLREAADAAAGHLKTVSDWAAKGKASTQDVARAFEAWAKAEREAADGSSERSRAVIEGQIAARAAVLGVAHAYGEVNKASEETTRKMIASMEAARSELVAKAQQISRQIADAIRESGNDQGVGQLRDQYRQVDDQLKNVNQTIEQTKNQLKQAGESGQQAGKQIGDAGTYAETGFINAKTAANTADKAIQEMTDNTAGAAEALAGVLNGMRDSLRQYGDAAVTEFDRILESLASVDRRWQTAGMTLTQILGKVAGIANAVAERHKIAQEAAELHARSMEYLSQNAEEAAIALAKMGYTLEDVRSGAVSANTALMALGNQRMDKLRPELQGVADALEGIEAGAREAVASLAEMNREMEKAEAQRRGDEREIARMEHEERLRQIDELAERAGATGAAEAAEARRRAEAEHQARLREIREREKEEKRANKSVDDERRARSGGGGGLGSPPETRPARQVDRVIRVEIPNVGNVDVADEDSARNLERGLQEVARAARAGRRIG
jgi:TP901 family phage tail tape measure protein